MAKIKSTAVKVFPSAFRGLATGTKYNPEARLNTEFNVTNLINRLASKDSFVISWNPGTKVIIFNIHGYYFESNLTELLGTGGAGEAWTNLYASIKLLPFQTTDSGNTSYKAFTLAGTEDGGSTVPPTGRILDVTVSGVDTFEGLDLHNTPITPAEGVYELHLLSGGPSSWAVPVTSVLKFKATDVEGLPTINNSTTANTTSTIFAPATAGSVDQILVSEGGSLAPTWETPSNIIVGEATQAVQLKTSRNLWGRPFNGTAAVSGNISSTGNITPSSNNASNIGASDNVYANVYATTFVGNLTGNVTGDVSGNVTGNLTGNVTGTASGNLTSDSTLDASKLSGTIPAAVAQAEWDAAYTHISNTSNPHSVTKSQVGLSNVTNDAQIKKLASSTNGNVPTWSGTSGDALASGYAVQTSLSSSTTALVRADAIQTALDLKAPLASPTFTGTVTLGSSTIGSGTRPIFLSSGTLTASSSNVGSAQQPVFLSSGTITAGKEQRFSYIVDQTGALTSTTWSSTTLSINCTAGKYYKIQGLLFFNRPSGNSTNYYLSLTHNQGGGSPSPSSYYFAHYRNASGVSTITPLYTLPFSSSVSDGNSITLEASNGVSTLSPLVIDGYFYSGNATSITLWYRMGTSGGGGINIAGFSHLQLTEM